MKFKTTRKAVISMFPRCYRVGYCRLQHLLHYVSPVAYTCGVYGWNFDIYNLDGVAITTGYRNMCGKQIPFQLSHEYDEKAREIVNDWEMPYEDKKAAVTSLLDEFMAKIEAI